MALLRLNRPEARNALSPEVRAELGKAIARFDAGDEARCIVIAGSDKVFAAGADIRAMAERPLDSVPDPAGIEFWRDIAATETPLIAAVS
ncbi:MAG TPA: enoyl-CoA hydratase-related protein, partial [Solirubrobacterales bacterium]|nr:enoyl-CoA hydratase-related protein [Solirubrobacterales bacterium]